MKERLSKYRKLTGGDQESCLLIFSSQIKTFLLYLKKAKDFLI
ncbi:hypothetical protein DB41_DN00200 [Neochlamydia sp. TUME1]|nr:hypothetical protein DB41_DN00200 [Neochlamydia sp. TUME1]